MPSRLFAKLAETPVPRLVRQDGVQEVYCDRAVTEMRGEMVVIHLCREIVGDASQCEVVGTIFMPLSGWLQSHAWAREAATKSRGH